MNVVVEHHWSAKTVETNNLEFTILTLDIETSLYRIPFSKWASVTKPSTLLS